MELEKGIARRASLMLTKGRPRRRVCQLLGITPRQLRYIIEQTKHGKTPKLQKERRVNYNDVPQEKVKRIKELGQFGDYSDREIAGEVDVDVKKVSLILRGNERN